MILIADEAELTNAAGHLARHDAVLKTLIARHGLADLRPHTRYYQELVDSIISQQLSVKAADAIERRFRGLFGGEFPTAGQILSTDVETLRSIGLSRPKARYILDLAQHIAGGQLVFDDLDSLSNDAIIGKLTAVKGIGEWTAHMFLMFCMARLDILATGDLGIRNSIRKLYGFEQLPTPAEITELAARYNWHPYESVACWYIWRSLDNLPAVTA
ncbi:MAG TPA: DNA-3-methyladenine glycosylase [Candidatus Saccharimonadales bacterium]